jgi:hypothetical protein
MAVTSMPLDREQGMMKGGWLYTYISRHCAGRCVCIGGITHEAEMEEAKSRGYRRCLRMGTEACPPKIMVLGVDVVTARARVGNYVVA